MCLYGVSVLINEGSKLHICCKVPEKEIILMSKYTAILLLAYLFFSFFLKSDHITERSRQN